MRRAWTLCALVLVCATTATLASARAQTRGAPTSTPATQKKSASTSGSVLVGSQQVQSYADSNPAGMAQAFSYTASASGTTTDIELYVNTGTTATKVVLGVYSNSGGKPGSLLASGSITSPQAGAWNDVSLSRTTITQGTTYWIALLPTGGQLNYYDSASQSTAAASYVDSNRGMSSLPSSYASGNEWNASPASVYVNGQTGTANPPPSDTALPAVSGTAQQGDTLTTTNGSWTGSPTSYAYQWQDCNTSGASCSTISGATSSSYTLASGDVGHTIRVAVTATNAGGSTSATSAQTATVSAAGSVLVGSQQVQSYADSNPAGMAQAFSYTASASGTTTDIELYVNTGTTATKVVLGVYSNSGGKPGSLLASGSITSPQAGAWNDVSLSRTTITQGTTYWIALLPTGGQLNYYDSASQSTAAASYVDSNRGMSSLPSSYASGNEWNASPASVYVNGQTGTANPPPSDTALPAVSGTAQQGDTLTTTNGSWTGSPTSYAYQWQDCNTSGASCSTISGATSSSYTLASGDVGHTIRVAVTATNAGGSTSATSAQTATVSAAPAPSNTAVPAVSGTAQQGDTLTTTNGSWTGSPTSYAYQWQDCNTSGASCSTISGATSSSHTLASSDVGDADRVVVSACNTSGCGPATSAQTATVSAAPAPSSTGVPVVSGTAQQGDTLSTTNGSWTGSPTSYSYQWQDCDSSGGSCSGISGASSSSYTLASSDVGGTVRSVVTATNANGSTSADSAVSGVVAASGGSGGSGAPVNTVQPYFTASTVNGSDSCTAGCAIQGQQLSVTTGSWSNSPTSYTYQWNDCTTKDAQPPTTGSCSNATGAGATANTYTVGASDVGKALVPIVTATNAAGSTSTTVSGGCDIGIVPPGGIGAHTEFNFTPGCSPISAVVGTSSATEEFCTNSFTTCGFGDPFAGSAGVPLGTTLTPYSGPTTITTAGTVIDDKEITSQLNINANNVTIENSDVDYSNSGNAAINVGASNTGFLLEHSSVHGQSPSNPLSFAVSSTGSDGTAITIEAVYVYNVDRIITTAGIVEDSVCLGNGNLDSVGEHYECTYVGKGSTDYVLHTVLISSPDKDGAAAFYAQGDFGVLSNIEVENDVNRRRFGPGAWVWGLLH